PFRGSGERPSIAASRRPHNALSSVVSVDKKYAICREMQSLHTGLHRCGRLVGQGDACISEGGSRASDRASLVRPRACGEPVPATPPGSSILAARRRPTGRRFLLLSRLVK